MIDKKRKLGRDKIDSLKLDPRYRLLEAELAALEDKTDPESLFGKALRDQLQARQSYEGKDRRVSFFQRLVSQMASGEFQRFVLPDPIDDVSKLGKSLADLEVVLDRKFAETRALMEVTSEINAGLLLDEVLDHVFTSFHLLIPYDRIGFALIDKDGSGREIVRSHWARSDFEKTMIGKGYSAPLAGSSLDTIVKTGKPRILNDLEAYLKEHPNSISTQRIVAEGVRSSLTCPLIVKGEPIGFMFFSSRKQNTYRDAHIGIYKEVAGQLALTVEKSRLYEELTIRNEFIRKIFGRYLTDEIAETLLNDPNALRLGGDKRRITILMSDLRGFTHMSDHATPEQVVTVLNNFLKVMVDTIMRHGGTIDNFIGDAILVLFGVPVSREDDARRAVACAVAMQLGMEEVNERNRDMGLVEVSMGIGINTGKVIAGNIGSEMHMKYSVIGSPVNLAARVESLTKGGQILTTKQTLEEAGDIVEHRDYGKVELKGFDEPVPVYEITGIGGEYDLRLPAHD